MAEVLVLVDHVDGEVRKSTTEMLTAARELGEPSVVYIGTGFEAASETLATYGAVKAYRVESPEVTDFLVAPTAEVLAHLVAQTNPAAVLVPSTSEGKEIAGRLAIKTQAGLITDAVGIRRGEGDTIET
ncbi:MAG: electron transfer flavoprotein subunit alpha/FixB family protein, partial [Ornithinimicrobium sp.]